MFAVAAVPLHFYFWFAITFACIAFIAKGMSSTAKGLLSIILNELYGKMRSSTILREITRSIQGKPKAPKNLPHLVDFEQVSSRTYRVLGLNPGQHTLQGTNTWLITGLEGKTTEHILIDTGEDYSADEYIAQLFEKVFPRTGTTRLSKILLTHGHDDHQGGVLKILSELKARNMLPLPTIHKRNIVGGNFPVKGVVCEHINDLDTFQVGDETTLQACYTPGHTDDHVGFVLIEDHALLSGDCVLGCGTTVFDNLYEYMQSLKRIRQLIVDSNDNTKKMKMVYKNIHTIYPGHGPVIRDTALEKIDEYIHHRELREKQILDFLARDLNTQNGHNSHIKYHPSWDIMNSMYSNLTWVIKVSAMHNVAHHLQKLQQEGKVEGKWPDQWRIVTPKK